MERKSEAEEQPESEYYYDDAHGYTNFDPESDDEEGEGRDGLGDEVERQI